MQTLFQNGVAVMLSFLIMACTSSYSSAVDFGRISVRNGEPKITRKEMNLVDSKVKSISASDILHGLVGGKDGERIYIYGKMYVDDGGSDDGDEGDGKLTPVIAVQFWMASGNADYQYLLILDRERKKIYGPLRIGGRGHRDIAIYTIKEGAIMACVLFYQPGDPMPQPSVNGNTQFRLEFGLITEDDTVVNDDFRSKKCIPRP